MQFPVLRTTLLCAVAALTSQSVCAQERISPERREIAALRADMQVQNENVHKLVAAIETLGKQNATLVNEINGLKASYAKVVAENRDLTGQVAELRQALDAERRDRAKMIDSVIATVKDEMNKIVSKLPARGTSGPAAQGEYTVARGDTLGAIAQAFNVSVKALKDANKLKNDLIREGQKLTIPAAGQ